MESDVLLGWSPRRTPGAAGGLRPYVTDTAISFEWQVPGLEEFRGRIRRTPAKIPLPGGGPGKGSAGLRLHRPPSWAGPPTTGGAETSIYLRRDCRHQGLGRPCTPPWRGISRPRISTPSTPASAIPSRRTGI